MACQEFSSWQVCLYKTIVQLVTSAPFNRYKRGGKTLRGSLVLAKPRDFITDENPFSYLGDDLVVYLEVETKRLSQNPQ